MDGELNHVSVTEGTVITWQATAERALTNAELGLVHTLLTQGRSTEVCVFLHESPWRAHRPTPVSLVCVQISKRLLSEASLQRPDNSSALEVLKRRLAESQTRAREQPHCLRVPAFARLLPAGFRCVLPPFRCWSLTVSPLVWHPQRCSRPE
jgi:hypothetical protein